MAAAVPEVGLGVGANSCDVASANPNGGDEGAAPAPVDLMAAAAAEQPGAPDEAEAMDEEVQEVEAPPPKKPIEEVILSSDSEGEGEGEGGEHGTTSKNAENHKEGGQDEDDSLEIVKVLPYSYMNRPRGPKTAFLRNLLQQTNEEIKQGRKITDNTYQRVPEASVPGPVAGTSRHIVEVTLSSDEGDETDSSQENKSEIAPVNATCEQNGNSNGQHPNGSENEAAPLASAPPEADVPVEDAGAQIQGCSTATSDNGNRKRSHEDEDNDNAPTTANSTFGNKKSRPDGSNKVTEKVAKQIKVLEALLESTRKKLLVVGEEEDADWEKDEENTAYTRMVELHKVYDETRETLCRIKGMSSKVGRPMETKIKLTPNLTEYPLIEKAVEDFVNSGKDASGKKKEKSRRGDVPTFLEVNEIVQKFAAQHCPSVDIEEIAITIYQDVVKKAQDRRERDSVLNGYLCEEAQSILTNIDIDPTFGSPELAAKLAENDRVKKPEAEVLGPGALANEIQAHLEMEYPDALEADADDCDSPPGPGEEEVEEDDGMINGDGEEEGEDPENIPKD